jgi:hypothetical protein
MQHFTIIDKFSFDTTGLYVPYLPSPSIELFPNPCNNFLNVKAPNLSQLNIYNLFGERVIGPFTKTTTDKITIDVSNLPSGIYVLQAIIKDRITTSKFIKQ